MRSRSRHRSNSGTHDSNDARLLEINPEGHQAVVPCVVPTLFCLRTFNDGKMASKQTAMSSFKNYSFRRGMFLTSKKVTRQSRVQGGLLSTQDVIRRIHTPSVFDEWDSNDDDDDDDDDEYEKRPG